jgi:hypothetical protein
VISKELSEFIQSGVSILIGSRDARRFPDCARVVGARVGAKGKEITVFLPTATTASHLANLDENRRIAICFARAEDHRSVQVKGRVLEIRAATEAEREWVDRYCGEFAGMLHFVGLSPRIISRMNHWPCHAVRLKVESVFVQTPGPGAGAPLGPPSTEGAS